MDKSNTPNTQADQETYLAARANRRRHVARAIYEPRPPATELSPTTATFLENMAEAFLQNEAASNRLDAVHEGKIPAHLGFAGQLLWDANNSLLATFILFERDYKTEVLAILRTVVERVASSLFLVDNPETVESFRLGRLASAETIGPAKRVLSNLGPIYGQLSEMGSHMNFTVGTSVIAHGKDKGRVAIGGTKSDDREEIEKQLGATAELLAQAPHFIFFSEERARAVRTPLKRG